MVGGSVGWCMRSVWAEVQACWQDSIEKIARGVDVGGDRVVVLWWREMARQ